MAMAEQAATISAMVKGPERDRLELIQRQSQALIELNQRHEDRLTLFAADPTKSLEDFRAEAERLKRETESQVRIFRTERAAQERQANEELHSEEVQARQAEIRLIADSYDREVALLKDKHAEEIRSYDQAGRDKTQLLRKQAAEEQEIVAKQREWVKSQLDALSPYRQEANFRRELKDARKAGALNDADMFTLLGRHDRPLDEQIKRDRIELDLARHRISEEEAERRRLRLSNPPASEERIDELARLQRDLQDARKEAAGDRRPMQSGEFSTRFTWGQVDMRAVNRDSPMETMTTQLRGADEKLAGILRILERIDIRGSLN